MSYTLLKKEECNYVSTDLELLRYAILEESDQLYLQMKLKNISDSEINSFTIIYKVSGEKCKYEVNQKSKPGEEFFDKTLIEIEDDDFEFISFKKIDKEINNDDYEENQFEDNQYDDNQYLENNFDNDDFYDGFAIDDYSDFGNRKRNKSQGAKIAIAASWVYFSGFVIMDILDLLWILFQNIQKIYYIIVPISFMVSILSNILIICSINEVNINKNNQFKFFKIIAIILLSMIIVYSFFGGNFTDSFILLLYVIFGVLGLIFISLKKRNNVIDILALVYSILFVCSNLLNLLSYIFRFGINIW